MLRYPLMAIMLLWALTLPGQEVEVYAFLFHGTAHQAAASTLKSDKDQDRLQQQQVHVFKDAKAASPQPSPVWQAPLQHPPFLLLLAFISRSALLPALNSFQGGCLLRHIVLTTIQPNAP